MYDAKGMFRAPPEWAERKRARAAEAERRARQARQSEEAERHREELAKQAAERQRRFEQMPTIARPADDAAEGLDQ